MRLFLAMLTGRRNLLPTIPAETHLPRRDTNRPQIPQSDKMLEYTGLYRLHYLNYT